MATRKERMEEKDYRPPVGAGGELPRKKTKKELDEIYEKIKYRPQE